MLSLRNRKGGLKMPTGRDAINFRKLLFLSLDESHLLLSLEQWERIDLRWLRLMKTKHLRAACIARELESKGGKHKLLERLIISLKNQIQEETTILISQLENKERQRRSLGGVWSFGAGHSGQLGHGDYEPRAVATQINCLIGKGIFKVFAGFDSDVAFALSKKGDVYVWGNREGPCGLNLNEKLEKLYKKTAKMLDDQPSDEDCSEEEEENEEIQQENNADIVHPVLVRKLCGEEINYMAVGRVHALAMTRGGDVFSWGHNDHCQLGNETIHLLSEASWKSSKTRYGAGTSEPEIWKRTIDENVRIVNIDVGTNHSMAVSDQGKLFSFGATYNTDDYSSLARSLEKYHVIQVSCGALHAGILTNYGQVLTWGCGDGGRLGHGDNTSHVNPRLVETLKNEITIQISCACWHTAAIVLIPPLIKGGFVYTWGSGRHGQLGQGGDQVVTKPRLVGDLLLSHVVVSQISTGMYHNAVLSADGEVFTWGSNAYGCLGREKEFNEIQLGEDFCVVPGKVEGLIGFTGKPISIACGKEFTLIVTKPYSGPGLAELELQKEEQERQRLAKQRVSEMEEKEQLELTEEMNRKKIMKCIEILNAQHPKCNQCEVDSFCPGYQNDQDRPGTCKHCLHGRLKHIINHNIQDKSVTLENMLDRIKRLKIFVDFAEIEKSYGIEDDDDE